MILYLLLMWITFAAMLVAEIRRRSPALLFVVSLLLITAPSLTIVALSSDSLGYPRQSPVEAAAFIVFFNLLYLVVRTSHPSAAVLPDSLFSDHQHGLRRRERRFLLAVLVILIFVFLLKLYDVNFSVAEIAARTWLDDDRFGLLAAFGANISFGVVLSFLILRRYFLAGTLVLAILLLLVVDRSRALAISAFAPLLMLFILRLAEGRHKLLKFVTSIAAVYVALLGHYVIQQIRYLGQLSVFFESEFPEVVANAVTRMHAMEGELSGARGILWVVTNAEIVDGNGTFSTLQRMATFWLPSSLKPVNITHEIAAAMGWPEGSYHPTIYGIAWLDGYWLGLVYAIVIPASFRILDRILVHYRRSQHIVWTMLIGPYCVFAVLAARGSPGNGWVLMVVGFCVLIALHFITSTRQLEIQPAIQAYRRPLGRK